MIEPSTASRNLRALAGFHRRWRLGLFLAELLRALAGIALALFALGIFDFYAGFADPVRRLAFAALLMLGTLGVLRALWKVLVFGRAQAAAAADRALASERCEVLSAFELASTNSAAATPLGAWLRERAVARAGERVRALPLARALPMRLLVQAGCWLAGTAILLGACALFPPSSIIARRLLQPRADIPPYTPLKFQIGPQPAEVIYGGEILVNAEITGGKLTGAVRCLTRDPATGRTDDSPAFQENAARYSRKLEKMAAPVEVAFAVGRARSGWMRVNVLMQPKVQDVLLTVQPPAYSGLPKRVFTLGSQKLAALPGSRITALVASNRPLGGGTLRLESVGATAQEFAAQTGGTHEAQFSWVLRGAARLVLTVRDVAGTVSEPVQLEQNVTADERPSVSLRQPSGEVLATADSELPLEADARDDLGLVRVALVRKLIGFRERAAAETVQHGERRYEFGGTVKLAPFGLEPGQTIELTLEAGDTNPNLLGVSVSDPARIHIIDHKQYAQILRSRVTLEEFSTRYESIEAALESARRELEEMKVAVESGDPKAAEAARQKAQTAHEEAGKRFGEIAKDFPIFDLDQPLSEAAAEVMTKLFENFQILEKLKDADPAAMGGAIGKLQERLGQSRERMVQGMDNGRRAIAAAKVFEKASEFQLLLQQQRDVSKDLLRMVEQIRRGETQAGQALRDLGRRQGVIAGQLRHWQKELGPLLDELPAEFARMRDQGREFLQALFQEKIEEVMEGAAKAAEAGDSRLGASQADVARQLLESLLKRENGMAQMCSGECDSVPFPLPEDLASTLNALMHSLIPRPGQGAGEQPGAGTSGQGGFGGNSESGYSMAGKLPRLPVFGPSRSRPGAKERGGPEIGKGRAGKEGAGPAGEHAGAGASDFIRNQTREGAGEAVAPEAVPERYRAAVKRYFSIDPAGAAPLTENKP